jgi:hypothetical protein
MYELVSENLSNLGGRMGTEYTTINYRKFFTTIDGAKKAAEKEYKKKIVWKADKSGEYWRSPDLAYVMYHIRTVRVES